MSETKTFEELFLSCDLDKAYEIKEIRILMISDIKGNHLYLQKLKEWQLENNVYFDFIFVLGNFLNLPFGSQNNEAIIPKSEADISSILTFLENITLNVVYIGGNHDSGTIFESQCPPSLTIKSFNLHQNYFKIADDLYLIGQGGTVSTIAGSNSSMNQSPFNEINFYQNVVDDGFPINEDNIKSKKYYVNDNNYGDSLKDIIHRARTEIKEKNETPNVKYIVLTHIGPFYSHTSYRKEMEGFKYTGSVQLNKILCENKIDIIANIHGGNALGKGVTVLNTVTVINPGEINKGNFGVLILKRDSQTSQWTIGQIELKNLL